MFRRAWSWPMSLGISSIEIMTNFKLCVGFECKAHILKEAASWNAAAHSIDSPGLETLSITKCIKARSIDHIAGLFPSASFPVLTSFLFQFGGFLRRTQGFWTRKVYIWYLPLRRLVSSYDFHCRLLTPCRWFSGEGTTVQLFLQGSLPNLQEQELDHMREESFSSSPWPWSILNLLWLRVQS